MTSLGEAQDSDGKQRDDDNAAGGRILLLIAAGCGIPLTALCYPVFTLVARLG